MIIAGRNRDRIDAASAAIDPIAFGNGQTVPKPNLRFAAKLARRIGRSSMTSQRLGAALRRRPLSTALPRPRLVLALLLVTLLATLADAFPWWAQVELRTSHGHAGLETSIRLLCVFAAVLFFDRYWRGRWLPDLLLAAALAIVSASDLAAGALLGCACVEWSLEERRTAAHVLARERRRMAADVHDLIMQDLSLALANARTLTDDPVRAPQASTVVSAGERALAGARDVVSGLAEDDTRPIVQAVEASVRAAARHTPLTFDAERVPSCTQLDPPTRDALVHIAREAVTNAVKHARPNTIEVVLEHTGQWRLTVRDDGRGFEHAAQGVAQPARDGGFGLLSMHRSAHALGGAVRVDRGDASGTTVEAVLP